MQPNDANHLTDILISELKRKEVTGSIDVAISTAKLIYKIVSNSKCDRVSELVEMIREQCRRLIRSHPSEIVIVNVACRMLKIIRVETATELRQKGRISEIEGVGGGIGHVQSGSKVQLVKNREDREKDKDGDGEWEMGQAARFSEFEDLRSNIVQEIGDFIEELGNTFPNIASHAPQYIHTNEIIMTCGYSKTVERFLKHASRKRRFSVYITECAPSYTGHRMAKLLASANIEAIVIPDSATFAIMSRVNKVILGARLVLANGGVVSGVGAQSIALSAKHHSTPVVVCAALYKLTPRYPFDQDNLTTLVAPENMYSYGEELATDIELVSPIYDYVAPELIDTLVDHLGGHLPSYVYRLLLENYEDDDIRMFNDSFSHIL